MTDSFSELLLPEALMRGLAKAGFETPTQVQAEVVPLAMDGLDLLVGAATGSGKTAAFLLPMMQRFIDRPSPSSATRGLVLVPTRELARQVIHHFMQLGSYSRLRAEVITGGESRAHQVAALRRNPEILVATPGRLLDLLKQGEVELGDLELLVLDEADRMLDMGFAEEVLTLIGASNRERQSLLFSATLHHRGLSRITDSLLREPRVLMIDPVRAQHPDIVHQFVLSDDEAHKRHQLVWLLEHEAYDKALVFVNTRDGADALAGFLGPHPVRAAVLHGELDQRERRRVMGLFHGGQVRVLIATDLAARGLDVPGVQRVINLDLPRSGDDYLHRTGRTGRAGETGIALSLVGPRDWNRFEGIARYLRLEPEARTIPGLTASFKGPTKRKGPGKPPPSARKAAAKPAAKPKPKDRLRDRKNIGKRRLPSNRATPETDSDGTPVAEAGLGPLRRRPSHQPAARKPRPRGNGGEGQD